jgi:hypothetical protein
MRMGYRRSLAGGRYRRQHVGDIFRMGARLEVPTGHEPANADRDPIQFAGV